MLAQELRDVYYEPLARVMPSVNAILDGPPVMKLLFMTDPKVVDAKLKPDWQVAACNILLLTCNLSSSNCCCSGESDDLHCCPQIASLHSEVDASNLHCCPAVLSGDWYML